ncbi:RusA family crossover junction endodeoxyribonuclease [Streptococcus suis]|uniref:RusA family crossover junction endodeoxyribonuclease n=1 Tax=Streptococcus suis TaxID=1307 RepID=UPI001479579C
MVFEFFLPMKKIPTVTHQQKQVRVVNGKPQFYEPERLTDARAKYEALLARHVPPDKLQGPIRLTVKWLFPRTKKSKHGQYKTTKPDTDNLQKLLKDCMTAVGFWEDDAQVASEIVEKFWSDQVGIYIKVEVLDELH